MPNGLGMLLSACWLLLLGPTDAAAFSSCTHLVGGISGACSVRSPNRAGGWSTRRGALAVGRVRTPLAAATGPVGPYSDMAPESMRVKQIKEELKERRINYRDCFDKESLVDKLEQARAGLIEAPPIPPPRGAAKGGFEYGAESKQGEEDASMEDAFKAAGWTGKEAGDPKKTDQARSPGLNRNFGDMDSGDFRKPYSKPR